MPRNNLSPLVCADIESRKEIAERLGVEKQFRRKNKNPRAAAFQLFTQNPEA
jgi:hypothetical protein